MKAIVHTRYGTPDVLTLQEVAKPVPANNEILIAVKAVEATKSDCEMRSFHFPVLWFWLPLRLALGVFKPKRPILGGYFSGVVEAVGAEVTEFKPGDPVFGSAGLRLGAYAEYLCLPASNPLVAKPAELSFEQAAAIPLGGINALHYLRRARVAAGEKVLVNGAGASIGTFAVQIAKAMGAVVTAVDSDLKGPMLSRIGADHVVDYAATSIGDCGQTFDVIFDLVAGSNYSECIRLLKPGGRYLMANPTAMKMVRSMITPLLTDKKVLFAFAPETKKALLSLSQMVVSGAITPTVDRVLPLHQVAQAHRLVEAEQRLGIIVLSVDQPDVAH